MAASQVEQAFAYRRVDRAGSFGQRQWGRIMTLGNDRARSRTSLQCFSVVIALMVAGPLLSSPVQAEEGFGGPTFRKGMWRFVRTLEVVMHSKVKHRLLEREMTRCVDPTQAMKATFSSSPVGTCHSAKPEKVDNKYIFSNRC